MVHWGPIDGPSGAIGQVAYCWQNLDSDRLRSVRMYFDHAEDWYMGIGEAQVKNKKTGEVKKKLDFLSTATHEIGHATGWIGHWKRDRPYCDSTHRRPPFVRCARRRSGEEQSVSEL